MPYQCAGTRSRSSGSSFILADSFKGSHQDLFIQHDFCPLKNHQGETHSQSLSLAVESLLIWCHAKNLLLSAKNLAGSKNILADLLSRKDSVVQTEWTLNLKVLQNIWSVWGKPQVDLFATKFYARLLYVSPVPDEQAWGIDAMTIQFDNLSAYAFPSVLILFPFLQKIRTSSARIILIAPWLPTILWFLLARDRSHVPPIQLNLKKGDLFQPLSRFYHQGTQTLNLHAWPLCLSLIHI